MNHHESTSRGRLYFLSLFEVLTCARTIVLYFKKLYRNKDKLRLEPGMIITVEPLLVEGHHAYITWTDGWSTCTVVGGMAAQFKHMVLIKESGPPEILTDL